MRRWLIVAVLVLVAAAAFVASGVYDIAATEQHTRPVYWTIDFAMRQSVRFHARDVASPALSDAAQVALGRTLYDAHCVRCHGAPGVAPESFALGLTPPPANLASASRDWPPNELFWTIQRGIKMTGMPAWQFRLDDGEIWAIVAYLQRMPHESPQEYRASAQAARPPSQPLAQPASSPPAAGDPKRGIVALRQYGCATCHDIPGVVGAAARVGPPLEKIATRTFVAGVVANDPDNLVRWIRTPQTLHPGNAMPDLGVTERDARDMAAYLYTLK
jgi:mono/diheme cytochrome c family protein